MGRPHKCPACGASDSVSKGIRRTKTMGERRIRLCRACGKKFTPKNQKLNDVELPVDPSPPSSAVAPETSPKTETTPPADMTAAKQPGPEAMDHPRF